MLVLRVLFALWSILLFAKPAIGQDTFQQFLQNLTPVQLPFECCTTINNAVEVPSIDKYLAQVQNNEMFFDFSNPYYGNMIHRTNEWVAFTIFNGISLEEEQGYDETFYLCTFTIKGVFIDCIVLKSHNLRVMLDEQTKRSEDIKGTISTDLKIEVTGEFADEMFDISTGEKQINNAHEKKYYQIDNTGKIILTP